MDNDEYWAHRAKEQTKRNAEIAKKMREKYGPVPSFKEIFAQKPKQDTPAQS